jgi:pimeloyl-ACP methyl ester carboxylesterase
MKVKVINSVQNILLCVTAVLGGALLTVNRAEAADSTLGHCQAVQLPVALAAGQPAGQTVSATYCQPVTWAPGPHQIDVLTAGATYDSLYWDWPENPTLYSYVDKTLQAGRATFNYDRIGTGASSHPLSTLVTVPAEAYVLHEIVNWAHDQGYSKVDLIGHSYGSAVTMQEAGTYQDANRVVVTGLLHVPNIGAGVLGVVISALHPAALDPEFSRDGLDLGYLTTDPGTRGAIFYWSSADPDVIAYDEAHKDVWTLAAELTFATTWPLPPPLNASNSITAPVLTVVGQDDVILCTLPGALDCSSDAAVATLESPYYTSAASLSANVVPDTGHDLALHPSADTSFNIINQWIMTH